MLDLVITHTDSVSLTDQIKVVDAELVNRAVNRRSDHYAVMLHTSLAKPKAFLTLSNFVHGIV